MAPPAKRRKTSAVQGIEPTDTPSIKSSEPNPNTKEADKYPGFDPWQASLELEEGDDAMSKFDTSRDEFVHSAKIYSPGAFKLKPLIISEDPLKGRQILMLEPVQAHIRFMDLPAELRNMVYEFIFTEHKDIAITTFTSKYTSRRPSREGFKHYHLHKGMVWDTRKGKWIGQTPSAHSLLGVSRQIQAEAAPVAYGDNEFAFDTLQSMKTFLDSIGSMCQLLKHVGLRCVGYHKSVASSAFHRLKPANNLKSLAFRHATVCELLDKAHVEVTPLQLAVDCRPMLKALQKAQKTSDNPVNVLDVIQLKSEATCFRCKELSNHPDCPGHWCEVNCSERPRHVAEIQSQIRKHVAEQLGIEEVSL